MKKFFLFLLLTFTLFSNAKAYNVAATWTASESLNVVYYNFYYSSNSSPFVLIVSTNALAIGIQYLPYDTTNCFYVCFPNFPNFS